MLCTITVAYIQMLYINFYLIFQPLQNSLDGKFNNQRTNLFLKKKKYIEAPTQNNEIIDLEWQPGD